MVHVYLLLNYGPPTLIDAGSGFGDANQQLLAGLEKVRVEHGESIRLADIERIIITHGHIDHFGGLAFLHDQNPRAEIAIHELDVRILTAFEERVAVAKKAIRQFLQEAGVRSDLLQGFLDIYGFSKKNTHSLPVARTLVDNQELDGLRFIHTPGPLSRAGVHRPGRSAVDGRPHPARDFAAPGAREHHAVHRAGPLPGVAGKGAADAGLRAGLGRTPGPDDGRLQADRRDSPEPRAQAGQDPHDHSPVARGADDQRNLASSFTFT